MRYAVDIHTGSDWGNGPEYSTGYDFDMLDDAMLHASDMADVAFDGLRFLAIIGETMGHEDIVEELGRGAWAVGGYIVSDERHPWDDPDSTPPEACSGDPVEEWTFRVEGSELVATAMHLDPEVREHYYPMP